MVGEVARCCLARVGDGTHDDWKGGVVIDRDGFDKDYNVGWRRGWDRCF